MDRGTEFSGLVSLESQYGIKTYYCHAYTPAERGSNERFNRNLRYFYPSPISKCLNTPFKIPLK